MTIKKAEQHFNCEFKKFEFNSTFFRAGVKKQFWAVGSKFDFKKVSYEFVSAGDWKTGERKSFKSWDKNLEIKDTSFRKKIRKESESLNSKLDLEEEKKWTEARDKAVLEIKDFKKDTSESQYLKDKRVKAFGNLYLDKFKNLIVPTYESKNSITGYQKITKSGKWFQMGQKMRGVYFPIGNIESSEVIYVSEGYATAATIHEITKKAVVVAFTCHNISSVMKAILNEFGHKKFVIAADNDKNNAGESCAIRSCRTFSNSQYIIPDFKNDLTALSDFNDLYCVFGLEETRKQLEFNSSKFNHVSLLGHEANKYFFYSERSKVIRSFSLSEMRVGDLVSLAKEDYWASKFVNKFDDMRSCDWKKTAEIIVDKQESQVGCFNPEKVRGFGFWNDDKDYIFNNGKEIYLNSKKTNFGYVGKYFYTPSGACVVNRKIPLKNFSKLLEAMSLTDFRSDKDKIAFLGFIAQAPIFSCLEWKSHLWFVGPAGSGKSTVLDFLNNITSNSRFFQDSSAAGIRQTIKSDALISIVDEAEGDNKKTKVVVDMARQSSSGQNTIVARGTPTGIVLTQNLTTVFCFASIQQPSMSLADESRILNVTLKVRKGAVDIEREEKRKEAYYAAKSLGDDIFLYMTNNIEIYKTNVKKVKMELLCCGATTRSADQNSNLIAGYLTLFPEESLMDTLNIFLKEDHSIIENVENSNDEFLEDFLSLKLKDYVKDVLMGSKIEDAFSESLNKIAAEEFLELYGLKIVKDFLHFSKNKSLDKELKNIGISNYWNFLKADKDNFSKSTFNKRENSKTVKSFKISKSRLFKINVD